MATPYYLYDLALLRERVRRAKRAMPATLLFAVKSNPNEAVLKSLLGEADGLDVASTGEIELALKCGWRADQLSFAGPAKTEAALTHAAKLGVLINAESPRELEFLATLNLTARVRVRVNPRIILKAWRVSMTGASSPFGIDEEELHAVVPLLERLDFRGLHMNPGGQCTSVGGYMAAANALIEIADQFPLQVHSLNFGGGWGITNDAELDIEAVGKKLREVLGEREAIVEPGRWLAAPCGVYVARVVSQKISRGTHFVMLDGGMNHHLHATAHLGGERLPIVNLTRTDGPRVKRTLVGPLCTALDTFGEVELVEPYVGDLIGIQNSGAYGLTFSPTQFLGHGAPAEYVRDETASLHSTP
ncbi:MAG: hypothetical protein ACO1OB_25405 [Archangium sp.]